MLYFKTMWNISFNGISFKNNESVATFMIPYYNSYFLLFFLLNTPLIFNVSLALISLAIFVLGEAL